MKKGLYEIFTVMFFIFAMLIALFLWLSVSGTVTLIKAEEGEQRLSITSAREAFVKISQCGSSIMQKSEIEECINQNFDFVKAIYVEQVAIDNCEHIEWNKDSFENEIQNSEVNTYPYWISIQNKANVCLAKVVIAI